MQDVKIIWVELVIIFQDKTQFFKFLSYQGPLGENSVSVKNVIIAFDVKMIIDHAITILVKIFFDHKGHVAE